MACATGVQVSTTLALTDLAYADDIAILGDSFEAVREMVNGVHRFANAVGLRIKAAKTKVLSAAMSPSSRGKIILDGQIAARINLARATFNRLHTSLWSRREISHHKKGRIYESVGRTVLLYGCESWPLHVEDQRRLEIFNNDCLRRILGCRHQDRIPCVALRHRLNIRALPPVFLQRRLRWFGHTARRPAGGLILEVINPEPPAHWHKKRGNQLKGWMTTDEKDLAHISGPDVFGLRRWNRD